MEQKRTLWIMAAVGVFLLVVLGAALILYSPTARSSQTIATVSPSNKQTSNGWVSLAPTENETTIPQTKMPATETFIEETNEVPQQNVINSEEKITRVAELTVYADKATIINNNPNENNVVAAVPSSVPEQKTAEQTHHTVINNTTTIDINPVISEKPVVTPKNELTKNTIANNSNKVVAKPVVKQVAKKEVSKPVSKQNKVTSAKTTTSKTTTATAKVTKTPAKPKVVQYWVQVTSLKSKKSAENAREVLDENKITADIFTYKDKKDQLFYRVRVGPYTTKSEAEYWQSKIAKIDTFASSSSYITSTTLD